MLNFALTDLGSKVHKAFIDQNLPEPVDRTYGEGLYGNQGA
jgi:hypothetical protein